MGESWRGLGELPGSWLPRSLFFPWLWLSH